MDELEKTLNTYFGKKAPTIPEDLQNIIVQYGPIILLIMVVLGAINLVQSFGIITSPYNPFGVFGGPSFGTIFYVYLAFMAVMLGILAVALPGLFKRKKEGWRYLYYAAIIGTIMQIVTFNIAGLIIGSGLSFYILFQIKSHYK